MTRLKSTVHKEESRYFRASDVDGRPPQQQPPLFCLQYLDNGKYCLSKCNKKEKASFADTLHRLSQLTWQQIFQAPKHGLGTEKIDCTAIKTGIPANITPDTNFVAFRFCGKKPMVGFKREATFHIIWVDRDFSLYKH